MLLKPILNKIVPFDADYEFSFDFSYSGNQSYSNQLMIYEEADDKLIYDNVVYIMRNHHTIPAHTLSNNVSYYARVICYDINNEASGWSDILHFTCYSTPVLTLKNLKPDGSGIIHSSCYEVQVEYSQSESRPIREYIFNIYDSTKSNPVYKSGTKYFSETTASSGQIISCNLKALENKSLYYFEFTGITADNVEVSIPKTAFFVSYSKNGTYSVINVECDKKAGYMKYNTYVVIVEGKTSAGNHEINNGLLEIKDGKIYYDTGFSISDDFIIGIRCKDETSIELSNADNKILLTRHSYNDTEYYKLEAANTAFLPSIQYSSLYAKDDGFKTIYIVRKNGLYDLHIITGTNFE